VRAAVLAATARLLEGGESYTTLGITRICAEAGVARSAFYTCFPHKSALLIALTSEATEDLFAASERWITTGKGIDGRQLERTIMGSFAVLRAQPAVLRAFAEVAAYDPDLEDFWSERMDRTAAILAEVIASAREAGTVRAGIDPAVAADFVVWGGERLMSRHVATSPPETDPDCARELAAAISAMLFVD
jgi:TetR/AcrR family transcriptional regulator, ethionamide resistance regulator